MIAAITAAGINWEIGKNGNLLIRIPEDMKRFRRITKGTTVIVGRVTYDSLPKKPLPNRETLLVSRQFSTFTRLSNHLTGSDLKSVQQYLSWIRDSRTDDDIFVMGGGQIYRELLDYCEAVYLTKVYKSFPDADTFFPDLDSAAAWNISEKSAMAEFEGVPFQYITYRRIVPSEHILTGSKK